MSDSTEYKKKIIKYLYLGKMEILAKTMRWQTTWGAKGPEHWIQKE